MDHQSFFPTFVRCVEGGDAQGDAKNATSGSNSGAREWFCSIKHDFISGVRCDCGVYRCCYEYDDLTKSLEATAIIVFVVFILLVVFVMAFGTFFRMCLRKEPPRPRPDYYKYVQPEEEKNLPQLNDKEIDKIQKEELEAAKEVDEEEEDALQDANDTEIPLSNEPLDDAATRIVNEKI